MKKLIRSWILGTVLALIANLVPLTAYADSATLYLSPGSGSTAQGGTLVVNIRENSGNEPVNSVQANLSYPANLLDFVSISDAAAWGVKAENSGGSGSVRIARGAFSPVTGDQLVATVRFKAKTNSGSATINFADGSAVISANSNTNVMAAANGGTYSFKAPVAAAETPAAPVDTTPPTIGTVNVTDVSYTSAVISWTTSEPATTEVNYGWTNGYGWVEVDKNPITNHKVTLATPLIEPGKTYHFMVKSVDPAGNAATGLDGTFTTKGAKLEVTVINQKDKPLSGAKVAFGDVSGVTKNGKVLLDGLPLGKQVGIITYKGKQTPASIQLDVVDPGGGKPHTAKYKIEVSSDLWLRLSVLILALAVIGLILYRRRSGSGPSSTTGTSTDTTTPGSGGFFGKLKGSIKGLKDRLPKKESVKQGPVIQGPVPVKPPPTSVVKPTVAPKPTTVKPITSGPVNQSTPPQVVRPNVKKF